MLTYIKKVLKLASMDKYGVSKWIKYGTSFIVELKNGWVVEIDRNGGRVLHIYDDKSKEEQKDISNFSKKVGASPYPKWDEKNKRYVYPLDKSKEIIEDCCCGKCVK